MLLVRWYLLAGSGSGAGSSGLQGLGGGGSGFGNNMNGFGSTNAAGMDALSQAYSGIQQYAGLSGLLNQGKSLFHDFSSFSVAHSLVGWRFLQVLRGWRGVTWHAVVLFALPSAWHVMSSCVRCLHHVGHAVRVVVVVMGDVLYSIHTARHKRLLENGPSTVTSYSRGTHSVRWFMYMRGNITLTAAGVIGFIHIHDQRILLCLAVLSSVL